MSRSVPVFALFCATASLLAQQQSFGGSLSGRLTDLSGVNVAEATVTVVQDGTERSFSTASDRNGRFQFADLPDGRYEVTVHRANFADARRVVTVQGHEAAVVSVQLGKAESAAQPSQRLIFNTPRSNTATMPLLDEPRPVGEGQAIEMPDMLNGLTAIQEFRVMNDAYRAGVSMGIPGANAAMVHGEVYGLAGNSLMGLNGMLTAVQVPLAQYGGSVGGASQRGGSSYFVGFDQNSMDRNKVLAGSVGQPLLQKDSAGHSLVSNQLLARIDHQIGQRDTVSARYSRSAMSNPLQGAGAPAAGLNIQQQTATVDNTVAISPWTINATQAQYVDGSVRVPAGAPAQGIQADVATARRYRIYEAADNLYHQMGRQTMQVGGDFFFNQMSVAFLEGASGNASFGQSSRNVGFYAQNQWKMRPDFVVTAGARYDLESLKNVHADTNNVAPQVGFAWAPGGSRSTVIRGGFGLMYEQLPLPTISGAADSMGAVNLARSGNFTAGRSGTPIASLASFSVVDPMIQNSYAEQANVEFEQQLGARTTVSASLQHVSGRQIESPGYNAAALCAVASGCSAGNEFYGGTRYTSGSNSSYDGLSVSFVQRPVRWGDYKVSYTYATAQSSGAQEYNAIVGDQMRRVSFTGALHTSPDAATNLWQNLSHNFALTGYGDFTRRNEMPGLDFIHFNAQLVKSFQLGTRARLEAVAQSFNMLEHRNYSIDKAREELGEYGVNILSSYERVSALATPNGSQVGLRLKF